MRVIARSGVRGLRVEKIAAEAGISTSLIYYHFTNRAGLLRKTLEFVSDRAAAYTEEAAAEAADPRAELELILVGELQDTQAVRENSTAWGELTSLVEGLSERWLSGSMDLDRARALLRGAIALELDRAGT